jgi:proline dehydrogenase
MSLARDTLIRASQSVWLREHATRWSFVNRASRRFLPGERVEDALAAAEILRRMEIESMLSRLGENVTQASEAEAVAEHYVGVLAQMRAKELPGSLSVKLTQLGLDLGEEVCWRNLAKILEASSLAGDASRRDTRVSAGLSRRTSGTIWIDMESSAYVDRTLGMYRRAREKCANVGVCLQAYLRRTPADLEALLPLGPAIRLVKGAYRESAEIAFPSKSDVDAVYFSLAQRMMSKDAIAAGAVAGIATHDAAMISRVTEFARGAAVPQEQLEFQMLYGIARGEQERLARAGHRVSVLISYGTAWFAWYMRRLAERPANVWFVVKNLAG